MKSWGYTLQNLRFLRFSHIFMPSALNKFLKNMAGKKQYTAAQKKAYAQKMAKKKPKSQPKKKKQQFQKKRQPFVESKKIVDVMHQDELINPLSLATNPQVRTFRNINMSPVQPFMFQTRGINNNQIIGRDVYSKFLQQKIQVELPVARTPDTDIPIGNTNRPWNPITRPCQIYVVWGWIKKPYVHRETLSGQPITLNHVIADIDDITANGTAFLGNPSTRDTHGSDYTTFPDRRKTVWTKNVRLLKPSKSPLSAPIPKPRVEQYSFETDGNGQPVEVTRNPGNRMANFGDNVITGMGGVLQTTISWKTNRKIRYNFDDTASTTEGFARDSWIPYSYLVIPKEYQDAVKTSTDAVYSYETAPNSGLYNVYQDLVNDCKLTSATCHWFSDS